MEFGNRDAWKWFNERFPYFVEKHPAIEALNAKIFDRQMIPNHFVDYVIFGLGHACLDDFRQILNLCGNGFGIGGMQLLRGMYERHVTAAYLSKYPDAAHDFVDYTYVHKNKAINHLRTIYRDRPDIFRRLVSEAEEKQVQADFKAVRDRFMDTKCETCDTKKPMFSWTKLDPSTLALKGGQELEGLHFYQYYRPTLLSHSTFLSVDVRVVEREDGGFFIDNDGSQRKLIPEALLGAHNLILNVFDLQNKHFVLGLDAQLGTCNKDYLECWFPNEPI